MENHYGDTYNKVDVHATTSTTIDKFDAVAVMMEEGEANTESGTSKPANIGQDEGVSQQQSSKIPARHRRCMQCPSLL